MCREKARVDKRENRNAPSLSAPPLLMNAAKVSFLRLHSSSLSSLAVSSSSLSLSRVSASSSSFSSSQSSGRTHCRSPLPGSLHERSSSEGGSIGVRSYSAWDHVSWLDWKKSGGPSGQRRLEQPRGRLGTHSKELGGGVRAGEPDVFRGMRRRVRELRHEMHRKRDRHRGRGRGTEKKAAHGWECGWVGNVKRERAEGRDGW